jgi:diaminopimelate epimerase
MIDFYKMSGCGNDFILIDNRDKKLDGIDLKPFAASVCRPKVSVGADGLIVIEPSDKADFRWIFLNADGSEAEMCGNGIRCVAKHLYDFGSVRKESMSINTLAGIKPIQCTVKDGLVTSVKVEMGAPRLDCSDVPMNCHGRFLEGELEVDGVKLRGTAVSMGNPHFIIFQELDDKEVLRLGPALERHPAFPRKTNVEFVKSTKGLWEVKVFERGAGWTQACGTGACATAVAATMLGKAPYDQEVEVRLPGGSLWITVASDLGSVTMRGPAVRVFRGELTGE